MAAEKKTAAKTEAPEEKDLNLPDVPPDAEPEADEPKADSKLPNALARRGIAKIKRVTRKAAEMPKNAKPALKRRWAS